MRLIVKVKINWHLKMTKRTTQQDFDYIANQIIEYLNSIGHPIDPYHIGVHFADSGFVIDAGRVTLQLLADRILYLTEDRKIAVCTNQPTN